ncbi:MAG: hypothetical protein MI685_01650 [Chlorobiales bacterium]|nr:hypothetical protein [Chlorobiales bacterium]
MSKIVATGKDLIAMLRDGTLLLFALLLIGCPQQINKILEEAGFEEGSFAGMKWKSKLAQSDEALLEAQATITDLKEQNTRLSKTLAGVRSQVTSTKDKQNIAELSKLNNRIAETSAKVQAVVTSTTSANAPLIQKAQVSSGKVITWGVVFGSDRNYQEAKYEVQTVAPQLGLTNAAIYYRNNSYRSVATTTDRLQAEQLLKKAKERRKDSYIVNMASWCKSVKERNGYFECSSS